MRTTFATLNTKTKRMVYTIPAGLRDREYDSYVASAGSTSAVAVALVSGAISVGAPTGVGSSLITNGSLNVYGTLSATSGSETWVQNFGDLGSSVVVSNFSALGSNVVVTNFGDLGSSVVVENLGDLGSSIVVTNFGDLGSAVVSKKGDSSYLKVLKTATSITATTTALWAEGAGSTLNVTDILISTGSNAGEQLVTLDSSTTNLARVYLASNGGFVSNLQTPISTAAAGSITMTTSSVGSTSVTLTGYVTL